MIGNSIYTDISMNPLIKYFDQRASFDTDVILCMEREKTDEKNIVWMILSKCELFLTIFACNK